jgi:hypothetical protein
LKIADNAKLVPAPNQPESSMPLTVNVHEAKTHFSRLGDFYEYSYRTGRSDQDVPLG